MFNRRSLSYYALALLCSFSGLSATAGTIGYEALEGNRCTVSTGRNPELTVNGGYDENGGTNASFGIIIPLGDNTSAARRQCEQFAQQDQARQHFAWLLDLYERGVITRESLAEQAAGLGMSLSPSVSPEARREASAVVISPR